MKIELEFFTLEEKEPELGSSIIAIRKNNDIIYLEVTGRGFFFEPYSFYVNRKDIACWADEEVLNKQILEAYANQNKKENES